MVAQEEESRWEVFKQKLVAFYRTMTCYSKRSKRLLDKADQRGKERVIEIDGQHCQELHAQRSELYPSNKVRTTKYTALTFVPKNLFEQFRRIANFYFLVLVIMQFFPQVNASSPGMAALPIIVIVLATMIKDGFEDLRRRKTDNAVNRSRCLIYDGKNFVKSKYEDIRVGDLVKLENDEAVPADIVILSSSEPNSVCYIETKNLDGETNLKILQSPLIVNHIFSDDELPTMKLSITAEAPNSNLYRFNGHLTVGLDGTKLPLTANNFLLRGSSLRNTSYVYGVVIYTGADTKLVLNSGPTPSKRTRIERRLNSQVLLCILVVAVISAVVAIGVQPWLNQFPSNTVFLLNAYSTGAIGILTWLAAVIILQNIIPISLYITLEVVKTIQAFFINQDLLMYDEITDTRCIPRAWNLSDDLGQIQYIFSDKTGTLTCNDMVFRYCSVAGVIYGDSTSDMVELEAALGWKNPYADDSPAFSDVCTARDLRSETTHSQTLHRFFMLLAVCHTVLVEKVDPEAPYKLVYKAQSPDEAALVTAAKNMGYVFVARERDELTLIISDQMIKLTVLHVLEFNSIRQRMSVIVRDTTNGKILLFIKGADAAIYQRLRRGLVDYEEQTLIDLEDFASQGLRTLCLAYRELTEKEYADWSYHFNEARVAIDDREHRMDELMETIEQDLCLLGATAIEDRLQDGVPESIATLLQAGLKIWVLTGDKQETAINVGFACNLLDSNCDLIIIHADDEVAVEVELQRALDHIAARKPSVAAGRSASVLASTTTIARRTKFALIIDGPTLKQALQENVRDKFLRLGLQCEAVICCRVSPLQKAQVVELVKKGRHVMTLAIGDGANDVSMLQQAHIGVGISGREGMQAAMSSDYAFCQFRFLVRLLLVHGHWSYYRVAHLILNFFYKNVVMVGVIFWFQIYCGFTAQLVFDYTYVMFCNLFFTVLPITLFGIVDQNISDRALMHVPQLYSHGREGRSFTVGLFWLYFADGVWQSLACFYCGYFAYGGPSTNPDGQMSGMYDMGTVMFTSLVVVVNGAIAMQFCYWTWLVHLFVWGQMLIWFIYLLVYSALPLQNVSGDYIQLMGSAAFWFTVLISVVIGLAPRFLFRCIYVTFRPSDLDIAREVYLLGRDENILHTSENVKLFDLTQRRVVVEPMSVQGSLEKLDVEATSGLRGTRVAPGPKSRPASEVQRRQHTAFGSHGHVRRKSSAIIQMYDGSIVANRGFAFSHQDGMSTIVTGIDGPVMSTPDLRQRRPGDSSLTLSQPESQPQHLRRHTEGAEAMQQLDAPTVATLRGIREDSPTEDKKKA